MRRLLPFIALISACSKGGAGSDPQGSSAPPAPSASAVVPVVVTDPDAEELRTITLKSSRALETVERLTDDVGPRLSGSPGFTAAVAWAKQTLGSFGLANVHAEAMKVPHWERGAESAEITAPYPHRLAITALGGSVATPPAGIEAEVMMVTSLEAVDALDDAAVKGKIVFINVRMRRAKDGAGYGEAAVVRRKGASKAAKKGAAALVIRSIGTDENRLPHTGALSYEADAPKIPAAALSAPDAEVLERLVADGSHVKLELSLGCKTFPDADGANVVGEVTGAKKPQEIVLLGAHLDSWDLGLGAIDDGAGIAIVTEAARQIAKFSKRPDRTIRVVLFANEENGLAGGEDYAKVHAAELDKHVVALEADFGGGVVYGARYRGARDANAAFERVLGVLAPMHVEVSSSDKAEGGADLSTLLPAGVPLIDLRQDGTLYFDNHHTANDTPDKIEKADIDQAAASFAAVAFAAARGGAEFGRIPEDDRKSRY